MDIKYLGHSSFKLNFKSASVITDPFSDSIGIKFPKESATIVTLSHDHDDHNNTAGVSDVKKVINGPGEYEVEGVSITGISTYHDDNKGEDRGKNTIYLIQADDINILHLGDLGHTLTEKQAEKLGDIDIMMIPVGGKYTIDAKQAVSVFKSIEPEITIPMHYKADGLSSTFDELTGVELFTNELGMPVTHEKKLSIKSSDFSGEENRVVVLETK